MSSISGFSTNSHLEDTGEDGGTGGGGGGSKDDKTSRGDPFAGTTTTSQASDPFAAFSVGGGDHFSSAGERKQNQVFRVVYIRTMSYNYSQPNAFCVQCTMYMYIHVGGAFKQSDLSAFDPFGMGETSFRVCSDGNHSTILGVFAV